MVYKLIISFYISIFLMSCCYADSRQAPPFPTQPTQSQWIEWIDRSKNRSLSRYIQRKSKVKKTKKKRRTRSNRQTAVQQALPIIIIPPALIAAEAPPLPLPLPSPRPTSDKTSEKENSIIAEELPQPVHKEEEKVVPPPTPVEDPPQPIAEKEVEKPSPPLTTVEEPHQSTVKDNDIEEVKSEQADPSTPPNILTPDLSTDFALSDIEQLLKSPHATKEVGLSKKSNSSVQPHLVNGKGVFLSIYDDRQESLAPLAPIPFLKVSSQSTFNYIEDLGVIFIPINGTYLIKYGFSGDGTHWGEECSSVQLTINETTIIPNSIITASREGVMTSHSIILPLKINDRVRLVNSTPTNSLTLVQPTPGAVTAYLEMILLE